MIGGSVQATVPDAAVGTKRRSSLEAGGGHLPERAKVTDLSAYCRQVIRRRGEQTGIMA